MSGATGTQSGWALRIAIRIRCFDVMGVLHPRLVRPRVWPRPPAARDRTDRGRARQADRGLARESA